MSAAHPDSRGNSIVVLDDEVDVGNLIADAAKRVGYTATIVTDPLALRAVLAKEEPTVLALDLRLPGHDGVALLRELGHRGLKSHILLISGMDQRTLSSAERLAVSHGLKVIGSIHKPFKLDLLREVLAKVAQQPQDITQNDLATAIQEGQFFVEYQPKIWMKDGKVAGAEALARWNRPGHGTVPPATFIPHLERSTLLLPFTLAILREAVAQRAAWAQAGYNVSVAVNVGAGVVSDLSLPDQFFAVLERTQAAPEHVILEVTETGVMADTVKSVEVLTRLRVHGFGLSMDDFGTGYSSLVELHRMPFNEIKIDRTFVTQMRTSHDAAVIVRSIADLGHNMGLRVCAEGVEDKETHLKLLELGADLGQGYLYGRPMTAQIPPSTWAKAAAAAVQR